MGDVPESQGRGDSDGKCGVPALKHPETCQEALPPTSPGSQGVFMGSWHHPEARSLGGAFAQVPHFLEQGTGPELSHLLCSHTSGIQFN